MSGFIHNLGYPWFELFGAPPFDTTMSLVKADLGSWCACETVPTCIESTKGEEEDGAYPKYQIRPPYGLARLGLAPEKRSC